MSLTQVDGGMLSPTNGQFYSMKNRIINGGMTISQRNGTTATANNSNAYCLDRWAAYGNVVSKYTTTQSTTAPAGFSNSLLVTSSAATTVGSGDYYFLIQRIEGNNVVDFNLGTANAKTFTLSFWVRSSLTGTFGGSLLNGGSENYTYPFTYTISSANTWEQKSITVAGPTAGTWLTGTSAGLEVSFGLGVGSTLSGTAGSWSANSYYSATGGTNVVSTNGATFYLTGVQIELGSTATSFDYRPYGTELALCQRYFQTLSQQTCWGIANNTQGVISFMPPVVMRATPSLAIKGTGSFSSTTVYYENSPWQAVGSFTGASADAGHLTPQGGDININGTFSSLAVNAVGNVFNKKYPLNDNTTNASYLTISAEL